MGDMSFDHCFGKSLELALSFAYSMANPCDCVWDIHGTQQMNYMKVHTQHKSVPITKGNVPIHSQKAMLSFSGYSFEKQ